MNYSKDDIEKYKRAKKELNVYKYIFALTAVSLFIGSFVFKEHLFSVIGSLLPLLAGVALRAFYADPLSNITNLVEQSINNSHENITNNH